MEGFGRIKFGQHSQLLVIGQICFVWMQIEFPDFLIAASFQQFNGERPGSKHIDNRFIWQMIQQLMPDRQVVALLLDKINKVFHDITFVFMQQLYKPRGAAFGFFADKISQYARNGTLVVIQQQKLAVIPIGIEQVSFVQADVLFEGVPCAGKILKFMP